MARNVHDKVISNVMSLLCNELVVSLDGDLFLA